MLKISPDSTLYWEIWEDDDELIIHWGTVGEMGETRIFKSSEEHCPKIEDLTERQRSQGFSILDDEALIELVIECPVIGFGTSDDLKNRHQLQHLLDERLGWTGNGYCEGGEMGSGEMGIFCWVVDPVKASLTIENELQKIGNSNFILRIGDDL